MQKKLFEPGKFVKKKEQVIIKSIKPKYVKPILDKTKKYEFMKLIFNERDSDVIIYSSSPVKRFVASFTPRSIFYDTPKKIWDFFGDVSGMTKEEFFKYFENHKMGYAVKIEDLNIFRKTIDPIQIFENFHAPQSFCYADRNKFFLQKINKKKMEKMSWNYLTDSEKNAMVYLYHLLDRGSKHYGKFVRPEAINKVIETIFKIQSAIEAQNYNLHHVEQLREICSKFKNWDGHHYFLFLTLTVMDFLLDKLNPRCKACGKNLIPIEKEGTPKYFKQYCIGCIENQLMEAINGIKKD